MQRVKMIIQLFLLWEDFRGHKFPWTKILRMPLSALLVGSILSPTLPHECPRLPLTWNFKLQFHAQFLIGLLLKLGIPRIEPTNETSADSAKPTSIRISVGPLTFETCLFPFGSDNTDLSFLLAADGHGLRY